MCMSCCSLGHAISTPCPAACCGRNVRLPQSNTTRSSRTRLWSKIRPSYCPMQGWRAKKWKPTVYGGMPGARRAGGAWDHHAGLMREVRPYALLDNEPQKCASRRSIAQYFWRSMASLYVANKAVSSLRKLSVMFYVRSTGFRREFVEINGIRDATSRTLS